MVKGLTQVSGLDASSGVARELTFLREQLELLRHENAELRERLDRRLPHDPSPPQGAAWSLRDAESMFSQESWSPPYRPPPPPAFDPGTPPSRTAPFVRTPPPVAERSPAAAIDLGYINQVGAEQLDRLPYGLMILDVEGQVMFYNETESRLSGFSTQRVIGKNFFKDVAPCTRVKEFEGRFRQFATGALGRTCFFDFAFNFSHGTQDVTIALSTGRRPGQVNVMMMRKR